MKRGEPMFTRSYMVRGLIGLASVFAAIGVVGGGVLTTTGADFPPWSGATRVAKLEAGQRVLTQNVQALTVSILLDSKAKLLAQLDAQQRAGDWTGAAQTKAQIDWIDLQLRNAARVPQGG